RSTLVRTRFIARDFFSGAKSTIQLSPKEARREFVSTTRAGDFALAPKGDGNYSVRFLEALALGRIPVLIDTDTELPLEDRIPYEKICVRVPARDIARTPEYIR